MVLYKLRNNGRLTLPLLLQLPILNSFHQEYKHFWTKEVTIIKNFNLKCFLFKISSISISTNVNCSGFCSVSFSFIAVEPLKQLSRDPSCCMYWLLLRWHTFLRFHLRELQLRFFFVILDDKVGWTRHIDSHGLITLMYNTP